MQVLLARGRRRVPVAAVPAAHTHLQAWGNFEEGDKRSGYSIPQLPALLRVFTSHWRIQSILTSPPLDPPWILGGFIGGSPPHPPDHLPSPPPRGEQIALICFFNQEKSPRAAQAASREVSALPKQENARRGQTLIFLISF